MDIKGKGGKYAKNSKKIFSFSLCDIFMKITCLLFVFYYSSMNFKRVAALNSMLINLETSMIPTRSIPAAVVSSLSAFMQFF